MITRNQPNRDNNTNTTLTLTTQDFGRPTFHPTLIIKHQDIKKGETSKEGEINKKEGEVNKKEEHPKQDRKRTKTNNYFFVITD